MNRRKFLTLSVATALTLPIASFATDYRAEKPAAWTAKTLDEAVKGLYGDVKMVKSDKLILKHPKVAANGGAVPVRIMTDLKVKSVALFQDSNPESAVAVWSVTDDTIVDYSVKLKLKRKESGAKTVITVIAEGVDGTFYMRKSSMVVARGGCEG